MKRRKFLKTGTVGALALHAMPSFVTAGLSQRAGSTVKIPLGICNHTLRSMKPDAGDLIDFAAENNLDSVLFNTLSVFNNLEDKYLKKIRKKADSQAISIYIGIGGICESSENFSDKYGDAKTLMNTGVRVARAVGSPIVGVRIGNVKDRFSGEGIKPKIEEVVHKMRSMREPMLDAGLKFAFENHSGDMRSEELLGLIEATGTDICGALFDPGNTIVALEEPLKAMETLGKNILACSVRDTMIWQSEAGASFQWTAIDEGLVDFQYYADFFRKNCPGVPLHIETISNTRREIPYLEAGYWDGFPDLAGSGVVDFLKMVKAGSPVELVEAPEGMDKKEFDIKHQVDEFQRSARYLREKCGVGIKKV